MQGDIDDTPTSRYSKKNIIKQYFSNQQYIEHFEGIRKQIDIFGKPQLDHLEEYFWKLHKNNADFDKICDNLNCTRTDLIKIATSCIKRGYSCDLRQFGTSILSDIEAIYRKAIMCINLNGSVTDHHLRK